MISIDIKLGACTYATDSAIYNLGGIVPEIDNSETQQVITLEALTVPPKTIKFNFCEAPLPPQDDCPEGDYFAFLTDTSCHGLKASDDEKANTVAVDMNDADTNAITGISLLYLSDDD